MQKMIQLRYYKEDDPKNFPSSNYADFCNSYTFTNYTPIRQLGIQTIPGTKIYLNQSINPIIIGSTGIFEIDCSNTTAIISSFRIAEESMRIINERENGYLIIDLVYGEDE